MPTHIHPVLKELQDIAGRCRDGWESLIAATDEQFALLEKRDREAALAGNLVGRYISEPFADGHAYYLITAAGSTNQTVRIQHLAIGDAWAIPYWGADATIARDYAERSVKARDKLAEFFSRQPQPEQSNPPRDADRPAGKAAGPQRT